MQSTDTSESRCIIKSALVNKAYSSRVYSRNYFAYKVKLFYDNVYSCEEDDTAIGNMFLNSFLYVIIRCKKECEFEVINNIIYNIINNID